MWYHIARVSSSLKLLSPSPLRWSGGAGGDPSVAQGLQHRLCGLHQGRGGGRRGAPPGGGRLKQPHNTTMFRRQITRQRQNVERNGNKETLPPTPSIAPMSPAVIIFYFCILFIAFYMERKLICRSDFCFIYFVPLFFSFSFFFKSAPPFTEHTFFFLFFCSGPSSFFQEAGVSVKRRYFILVSFVVLKQTPTLGKKKKKSKKQQKPAPFSSLITWTLVDLADDLWVLPCLGAISIVHIPQAWRIHPWIYRHTFPPWELDAVCGRCGRCVRLPDAAASCRLQTRNSAFSPGSPLYFPNGTFSDISQAATVRKYTVETTRSTPISQRQKRKKP